MPMFSIVIPCFNVAKTLAETVATLHAQEFEDWEAILVDDGSTDTTQARLEAAMQQDRRIRVVHQQNAGPSAARNLGVALASAPWIAFLDADDLWLPGKLNALAQVVAGPDAPDAVFGTVEFFRDEDLRVTAQSRPYARPVKINDMLNGNPTCTLSNLSVRKSVFEALDGFRQDLRHSEDLEFLFRLVAGGHELRGVPETHVRYRTSLDGLSADLRAMHEGWRTAVATVENQISGRDLSRAEARHLRYLARRALRIGAPATTALSLTLQGVTIDPRAFLSDGRQGLATLAGCLSAPLIPKSMRRRVFA